MDLHGVSWGVEVQAERSIDLILFVVDEVGLVQGSESVKEDSEVGKVDSRESNSMLVKSV